MIRERLISLFNRQRTTVWFEERTGIKRYRWQNIKSGHSRLGAEEIEAVVKLFPEYSLWLVSGEIAPEVGQTSPEYDEVKSKLDSHAEG
ncbi:DNA-binding protein [Marinobacter sp. NFXS11]|uniref:DNA-binding protein n=1 Tax=Marinobacter sp. NFXS11 TaxID=2818432 RepID=UPI0032DEF84C